MKRPDIIKAASSIVEVDRMADHGKPEDSFALIAGYWSLHLGVTVSAVDVAVMMTLLKLARINGNPQHLDSWTDGIGYLACGGEIATEGGK